MKTNRKSPASRRGVLLLVILGMLAMFGLVAVAFVVVAGQAQRSARTVQRIEQAYDPSQQVQGQVIKQILSGSNNPQSVMGAHGLLENIYGNETYDNNGNGGLIQNVNGNICGQQLFEFDVPGNDTFPRMGCVLTMLSGRLTGQSTHIVSVTADGKRYQARAFEGGIPANGDGFIINGAPFSGTGFGYNLTSGKLDATYNNLPVALLPNLPLSNYYNATSNPKSNPPGGANPDYNAPDYQTMLLGAVVYDPVSGTAYNPTTKQNNIIPSLHRPDLIAYWQQQGKWNNADLQRLVMLRPNAYDHPNFPGNGVTGAAFNPITGPWDVCNDGDGIPDSVWVDFGLPARAAADGRWYKPMVAVLCVDMDGRLNVNAHGTIWQTQQNYYTSTQTPVIVGQESPLPAQFAGPTLQITPARGQGYGPAEINLLPLFMGNSNEPAPMDRFRMVLTGYPAKGLEGRYGELQNYGTSGFIQAGYTGVLDYLTANKLFQYGPARPPYQSNYWDFFVSPNTMDTTKLDAYGAPPDISGTGAVALDLAGRPLYLDYLYRTVKNPSNMGVAFPAVDNPYEINLSQNVPRGMPYPLYDPSTNKQRSIPLPDNPFSVAELERILRPFDKDSATLSGRLFQLTAPDGITSGLLGKRHDVTTDSWNVPTPSPAMTAAARKSLGRAPRHMTDLLRASGVPNDPSIWMKLLPLEMLSGCKLDISRPLGNGQDSNGNGVVNDPAEYVKDPATGNSQQPILLFPQSTGNPVAYPYEWFGSKNETNPSGQGYTPQELQARYLYVLAMLVCDLSYLDAKLPNPTGVEARENTCRFLAQWAVNVVDFCGRNSIMTRFDYSTDIRNGWNPDGQHVVWGCKRPELLFSEAVAFHDRRTEDLEFHDDATNTDNQKVKPTDPKAEPDKDFDQRYRPQGSLFFELYNPQSPFNPPAGEFYSGPAAGSGVVLSKTTPNGDPVWRVIVTLAEPGADEQRDPDDPNAPANMIKRSIYFVNPAGLKDPNDGTRFYPGTPRVTGIVPGAYAVVGPAEKGATKKRTYLGFETGKTAYAETTRYFTLDTAEVTAANPAVLRNNGDTTPPVNPPELVAIDTPRRLSLSEPLKGYDALEGTAEKESSVDPVKYKTPFDTPFDKRPDDDDPGKQMWDFVGADKTTVAFRMLHLQRLANPMLPFDPKTNPYRTIDSMAVDLTAFNGIESSTEKDPSEPPGVKTTMFESRQRGDTTALVSPDPINGYDIWKQEQVEKPLKASTGAVGSHIFDKKLTHSFGFLSRVFGTPRPPANGESAPGAPQLGPFPWLTWNNRPFTSPLELMLVPIHSSSKLLVRPRADTGNSPANRRYYNFVKQTQAAAVDPYMGGDKTPYTHLLNFFQTAPAGADGLAPGFYRMLDYIHIPSHYAGTEVQINPELARTGNHWFRPPFNGIPTYREPGRMNLNTILCQEAFAGLMNYYPGWETAWPKFVQSRRGDSVATGDMWTINSALPSRFSQPFRTFAGADLTPPGVPPGREVDATLLRSDPAYPTKPLFRRYEYDPPATPPAWEDTNRNPYFRYQALSRLGNLVTTHSNVFAVWVTVGYFEVKPWDATGKPAGAKAPSDGYEILTEMGSDTGNIERHRAFYIIDRTIPVGFMRGKDLNGENAILLKRTIE